MANFYESGYASAAKAAGVSDANGVRRLQESLNAAGASLDVDGIYGPKTDEAFKKYGTALTAPAAEVPAVYTAAAAETAKKYNTTDTAPDAQSRWQEAKSTLESVLASRPAEWDGGSWASELAAAYSAAAEAPEFRYDLAADPLWQSYAARYQELGEQAMMDTMGRAAALTGGYGSSYAQTVGQQQYGAYLERLADIAPELASAAYGRWRDGTEDVWRRFDAATDLYDRDYKAYSDSADAWQSAYSTAKSAENSAYGTMLSAAGSAHDDLVKLISATGYSPTDGELDAAGMNRAEAQAWLAKYISENAPAESASASGGSGRSGKAPTDAMMSAAMQLAKAGDSAGLELFCREKERQGYDGNWLYSTYSPYIPAPAAKKNPVAPVTQTQTKKSTASSGGGSSIKQAAMVW